MKLKAHTSFWLHCIEVGAIQQELIAGLKQDLYGKNYVW